MSEESKAASEAIAALNSLRDLSDFCTCWPELRVLVADERIDVPGLPEETKATIAWLRQLAERVTVFPPPPDTAER